MTARPNPNEFELDTFLTRQNHKSLLRFVACGAVDHGKSTLIGRLLYEAKLVFQDQLDALVRESRKYGTQGHELDFSLLLDGLASEREQKITIDVAYRFFTTERRKFIVADAPGHEQYTRNMATGASTADLALIVVNAEHGITRQTKRHAQIVSTLGVRHFLVAVNKMDRVAWSNQAFRAIEDQIHSLAANLDIEEVACIPVSAHKGDNIVRSSCNMHWYDGPTVLCHLENAELASAPRARPFRMPVQLVNRPTSEFRGYGGQVAGGGIRKGMQVVIAPSGQQSTIERIVTYDGDVESAAAGQSVTLTLADDVDVSRGDVLADIGTPPTVTDRLAARIVWMDKEPLVPGRRCLVKLATSTAAAAADADIRVLDLDTGAHHKTDGLAMNDIGRCVLQLDRPIAADRYADCKDTGSFILIDRESCDTIGMGFVE
ncbi:MAG: sulfate adenylyltransferase subunit 1 [Xanthobacteraceae bacterium]